MNAVEIEEAVTELASTAYDAGEFPFAFLQAFGNRDTTIRRLRSGATNRSDCGGVLQTNHIHIATADPGETAATLDTLRDSPATARARAKYILATDGEMIEAEELALGETLACAFTDLPDHFGFFLALAGISTAPPSQPRPKTSCWPAKPISPPPSPTSMPPTRCPKTCAPRMRPMTS